MQNDAQPSQQLDTYRKGHRVPGKVPRKGCRRRRNCRVLAVTAEPHPFCWNTIEEEPKVQRSCLVRAHKTMQYEILHTGGFLRLCTERGRVYWLAQNMYDHRTPDWKIHFSVLPRHVPRAWDLLSRFFMDKACDFGMKAVSADALDQWPDSQRGRELTVYIFQYDQRYADGGPMMDCCPPGTEHRFFLGPEFQREGDFWTEFIVEASNVLVHAKIESNGGIADGDLPLGGPYASLRNEAFVLASDERAEVMGMTYVYPPNSAGWNAAGHIPPMAVPNVLQRLLGETMACCKRRSRDTLMHIV